MPDANGMIHDMAESLKAGNALTPEQQADLEKNPWMAREVDKLLDSSDASIYDPTTVASMAASQMGAENMPAEMQEAYQAGTGAIDAENVNFTKDKDGIHMGWSIDGKQKEMDLRTKEQFNRLSPAEKAAYTPIRGANGSLMYMKSSALSNAQAAGRAATAGIREFAESKGAVGLSPEANAAIRHDPRSLKSLQNTLARDGTVISGATENGRNAIHAALDGINDRSLPKDVRDAKATAMERLRTGDVDAAGTSLDGHKVNVAWTDANGKHALSFATDDKTDVGATPAYGTKSTYNLNGEDCNYSYSRPATQEEAANASLNNLFNNTGSDNPADTSVDHSAPAPGSESPSLEELLNPAGPSNPDAAENPLNPLAGPSVDAAAEDAPNAPATENSEIAPAANADAIPDEAQDFASAVPEGYTADQANDNYEKFVNGESDALAAGTLAQVAETNPEAVTGAMDALKTDAPMSHETGMEMLGAMAPAKGSDAQAYNQLMAGYSQNNADVTETHGKGMIQLANAKTGASFSAYTEEGVRANGLDKSTLTPMKVGNSVMYTTSTPAASPASTVAFRLGGTGRMFTSPIASTPAAPASTTRPVPPASPLANVNSRTPSTTSAAPVATGSVAGYVQNHGLGRNSTLAPGALANEMKTNPTAPIAMMDSVRGSMVPKNREDAVQLGNALRTPGNSSFNQLMDRYAAGDNSVRLSQSRGEFRLTDTATGTFAAAYTERGKAGASDVRGFSSQQFGGSSMYYASGTVQPNSHINGVNANPIVPPAVPVAPLAKVSGVNDSNQVHSAPAAESAVAPVTGVVSKAAPAAVADAPVHSSVFAPTAPATMSAKDAETSVQAFSAGSAPTIQPGAMSRYMESHPTAPAQVLDAATSGPRNLNAATAMEIGGSLGTIPPESAPAYNSLMTQMRSQGDAAGPVSATMDNGVFQLRNADTGESFSAYTAAGAQAHNITAPAENPGSLIYTSTPAASASDFTPPVNIPGVNVSSPASNEHTAPPVVNAVPPVNIPGVNVSSPAPNGPIAVPGVDTVPPANVPGVNASSPMPSEHIAAPAINTASPANVPSTNASIPMPSEHIAAPAINTASPANVPSTNASIPMPSEHIAAPAINVASPVNVPGANTSAPAPSNPLVNAAVPMSSVINNVPPSTAANASAPSAPVVPISPVAPATIIATNPTAPISATNPASPAPNAPEVPTSPASPAPVAHVPSAPVTPPPTQIDFTPKPASRMYTSVEAAASVDQFIKSGGSSQITQGAVNTYQRGFGSEANDASVRMLNAVQQPRQYDAGTAMEIGSSFRQVGEANIPSYNTLMTQMKTGNTNVVASSPDTGVFQLRNTASGESFTAYTPEAAQRHNINMENAPRETMGNSSMYYVSTPAAAAPAPRVIPATSTMIDNNLRNQLRSNPAMINPQLTTLAQNNAAYSGSPELAYASFRGLDYRTANNRGLNDAYTQMEAAMNNNRVIQNDCVVAGHTQTMSFTDDKGGIYTMRRMDETAANQMGLSENYHPGWERVPNLTQKGSTQPPSYSYVAQPQYVSKQEQEIQQRFVSKEAAPLTTEQTSQWRAENVGQYYQQAKSGNGSYIFDPSDKRTSPDPTPEDKAMFREMSGVLDAVKKNLPQGSTLDRRAFESVSQALKKGGEDVLFVNNGMYGTVIEAEASNPNNNDKGPAFYRATILTKEGYAKNGYADNPELGKDFQEYTGFGGEPLYISMNVVEPHKYSSMSHQSLVHDRAHHIRNV